MKNVFSLDIFLLIYKGSLVIIKMILSFTVKKRKEYIISSVMTTDAEDNGGWEMFQDFKGINQGSIQIITFLSWGKSHRDEKIRGVREITNIRFGERKKAIDLLNIFYLESSLCLSISLLSFNFI